MASFTIRRLLASIPVLLLSSMLVFAMVANSGDPLGELRSRNPPVPAHVIEARRHQLQLDRSLPERYWQWMRHFVRGDMGQSITGLDVQPLLVRRMATTLRMVLLAIVLAALLAVGSGVVSAVRQYTPSDYLLTFAGFLFLSMPTFWLAAVLKEFGAIRLNQLLGRQWVFVVGSESPNLTGPLGHRLADYAGHLFLPTLAIALTYYASWSRFQRAAMLEVLGSDYLRMAKAKGLARWRVTVLHALRTSLAPLVTVMAIDAAGILGGVIVVEQVFSWHGMGELFVQGVQTSDMNIVLACLMVSSGFVVLFNLVADLLYAVLDPRVRDE
jgi:peptide/nickel transport system permease protein